MLKSPWSVKSIKFKQIVVEDRDHAGGWALLDGGATQARPEEMDDLVAVEVELASGSTTLQKHHQAEALLAFHEVEPIAPFSRKGVPHSMEGSRIVHQVPEEVLKYMVGQGEGPLDMPVEQKAASGTSPRKRRGCTCSRVRGLQHGPINASVWTQPWVPNSTFT